jgi:hypothetical protein
MRFRPLTWPVYYYAATLIFVVLDVWAGENLRAVGFANVPGLRAVYYAVCISCAAVIRIRPGWAAPITLTESAVNLTALCTAILSAYYIAALDQGSMAQLERMPELLLNFVIAGSAGTIAFYQSMARLPGVSRS